MKVGTILRNMWQPSYESLLVYTGAGGKTMASEITVDNLVLWANQKAYGRSAEMWHGYISSEQLRELADTMDGKNRPLNTLKAVVCDD